MDPHKGAQDIMRCDLCRINGVQRYCDFCKVRLCQFCIGEHISDEYEKHKIVSFHDKNSSVKYPMCKTHPNKICKLQCKRCNIYICAKCMAMEKHKSHDFLVLKSIYQTTKMEIEKDAEELEVIICPTYSSMITELEGQIADLDAEYEKLTMIMAKHGKEWHRIVDDVINKMINEMNDIKKTHSYLLKKQLVEIKQLESSVKKNLSILQQLEESNEVTAIMEYRSRNKEHRKLPAKVQVSMPKFCPNSIDTRKIYNLIGSINSLVSTADEHGYSLKTPNYSFKELLNKPKFINTFNTGAAYLCSVSLQSDQDIWTSGGLGGIKCFDNEGKLLKAMQTNSMNQPCDIALISKNELVYSDSKLRTVSKISNRVIEEIIQLHGWTPTRLCVTSCDQILVVMHNDAKTQSRVVRYKDATEIHIIQYDKEGKPLYSGNDGIKYIAENRNKDICVADTRAGKVVVVTQIGSFRFHYSGHLLEAKKMPFKPRGITTDSQRHILISDFDNNCVRILDGDGKFLRYIENVKYPTGLCVDKFDKLFVANFLDGDVQIIRYLKKKPDL